MHLHVAEPVRHFELVHDPDAELVHALSTGGVIVALRDHHVAARAVPPLQVASPGRPLLGGRDDLDELVPDGEQRVLEPERRDPGIPIADLEPEDAAQVLDDRLELGRHERDLTQSKPHGRFLLPAS